MHNIFYFIMTTLALISTTTAQADIVNTLEKSLMPGALSKAHAKFESDCNNCHRMFDKNAQNTLCVDCHDHKNIKNDINNKTGLHGRSAFIKDKSCRDCHIEHRGRDNSLILFDKELFDHKNVDFSLNSAHRAVQCKSCHDEKRKFHQAPSKCIDCHKETDIHKGSFGKACGECHVGDRWRVAVFDHDNTKFKLKNSHKDVSCIACHPQNIYRYTNVSCDMCHRHQDIHEEAMGRKCEKCHTSKSWSKPEFDHTKDTDFELKGFHKNVSCKSCHRKNPFKEDLTTKCQDCHKHLDRHEGNYGKKCASCHTEKAWNKAKFNHDKTKFKLIEKHRKVDCDKCHVGEIEKRSTPRSCFACHEGNDIHREKLGKQCTNCHRPSSWKDTRQFDHDLSKFPLSGAHSGIACEQCHLDRRYRPSKFNCSTCHDQPKVHLKLFGEKCETCHFVIDWKAWQFDHDKQSDFKLEGRHQKLGCYACHKPGGPTAEDIPKACYACHKFDDVHEGQFGKRCSSCHNQKDFKEADVE